VLEDVVFHEVVGAHEQLDPVAQVDRVLGPVEIAVPDHAVGRQEKPDVVAVGIDVADALHPAPVGVEELDARPRAAVGVVDRQVLDAVAADDRVGPPGPGALAGPPVGHVEARGDGDRVPVGWR
jgi:hypothetical protein